jgi:basic amino acid/polyamine antiporter, APA family
VSDAQAAARDGILQPGAVLAIVLVITTMLVIGIKESANFNSAIVIVKLGIVGIFIVLGGYFLFSHPRWPAHNWHPFIPPSTGTATSDGVDCPGRGFGLLRLYRL